MLPEFLRKMFAYDVWANRRVWACIEALSEEQFDRELPYSIGSVHRHSAHMMGVQFWWFNFLITGELQFVTEEDRATRQSIRAKWDPTESMIGNYLTTITDNELNRMVKPGEWTDEQPAWKVSDAIFQIFNHTTDHRAQVLAALFAVGGETTPQDYLFFHFDQAGVAWVND